jgi:hypothetical protein
MRIYFVQLRIAKSGRSLQLSAGRAMDADTIGVAYVATACRNEQSRFAKARSFRGFSDVLDPVTLACNWPLTKCSAHIDGHNAPDFSSGKILQAHLQALAY